MTIKRYERQTKETSLSLELALEPGEVSVYTGCAFLDHMLHLLGHHAGWTLSLEGRGDLHVDAHHLTEDVGILLGSALLEQMKERSGFRRYGSMLLPMDASLVMVALDISGRGGLVWNGSFPTPSCGDFDMELIEEFWKSLAREARITLHIRLLEADNSHHAAEATFKAVARALGEALSPSAVSESTKGNLW